MITPVILSGGSGTRLWPLSRPERPKQMLPLTGLETMLQLTARRVADRARYAEALVVTNLSNGPEVLAQLTACGAEDATLILEPSARNTAAAIALAALSVDPGSMLLVMPSDHSISDLPAFQTAIDAGLPLAEEGWLLTFGMTPTAPEIGFGYIECGETLAPGVRRAARFVEKPDLATAKAYLESSNFLWNGGIFLFRAQVMIDVLATFAPEVLHATREAIAGAARHGQTILPLATAFANSPSISIDVAVMERSNRVAVVPVAMGWSDVGSWDALYEIAPKEPAGNSLGGDIQVVDASNLLVRAEGLHVTCIDVHDLTIVATRDAVLVMPRGSSQRVREAVAALTRDRA